MHKIEEKKGRVWSPRRAEGITRLFVGAGVPDGPFGL